MLRSVPYAWRQLSQDRLKLFAAVLGIAFAVVLVFMQLGLRAALFDSSVRLHRGVDYQLVLLNPRTNFLARTVPFPRSRLYQVASHSAVVDVAPLYLKLASYYYDDGANEHETALVIAIDPTQKNLRMPGVEPYLESLRNPDTVIIDRYSRKEFATSVDAVLAGEPVELQLQERHVNVIGAFGLGTSFGVDGSFITSDLNFRRIFPQRPAGNIDLGLIRLRPGSDVASVQKDIRALIPGDVEALTRQEYVAKEIAYWNSSTPIGYIFSLGAVIGVIVGLIVVYQILFSDVQSHLAEYATLKAIGYSDGFLRSLVLREAICLAVLGFIPAFGFALLLYDQAANATQLPMHMTAFRASLVLVVTIGMCALSGLLAMRKISRLDPAEVF
ncbi:MAG: ABC transporter permease DevC [Pseudomonadota bacterium]